MSNIKSNFDVILASFDSISEVNMVCVWKLCGKFCLADLRETLQDYTITMYLNQYWRDERLAFNAYSLMLENMDENEYMSTSDDEEEAKDMITLSGDFAEKIWVPDTFFANDKNRFESSPLHIEEFTNSIFILLLWKLSTRCHRAK